MANSRAITAIQDIIQSRLNAKITAEEASSIVAYVSSHQIYLNLPKESEGNVATNVGLIKKYFGGIPPNDLQKLARDALPERVSSQAGFGDPIIILIIIIIAIIILRDYSEEFLKVLEKLGDMIDKF